MIFKDLIHYRRYVVIDQFGNVIGRLRDRERALKCAKSYRQITGHGCFVLDRKTCVVKN